MILLSIIAVAAIIIDRISKIAIINSLNLYESVPLIKNIVNLTYVKNTGAAFSIFENGNALLTILCGAIILIIIAYAWYRKPDSKIFYIAIGMLLGGAIGNLIDRVVYGSVIDYIDIQFMRFAVFNVADCFVVCGCILLGIYILFEGKGQGELMSDEKL